MDVDEDFCIENGEVFKVGKYDEIKIVIREKDGYINASNMCSTNGRHFRKLTYTERWKNIIDYWNSGKTNQKNRGIIYCIQENKDIDKYIYKIGKTWNIRHRMICYQEPIILKTVEVSDMHNAEKKLLRFINSNYKIVPNSQEYFQCSNIEDVFNEMEKLLEEFPIIQYEKTNKIVPIYEIKKGYPKNQGQYIHPKLVHFVAEWLFIEYSFRVLEIINKLNDKNL